VTDQDPWGQFPDAPVQAKADDWSQFPDSAPKPQEPMQADAWAQFPDAGAPKQQMPGVFEAGRQGFVSSLRNLQQTGQAIIGETPTEYQQSPAAAPYEWGDIWTPSSAAAKTAYRLAESSPTLGGGVAGAAAGTAINPGLGTVAGGALGAGAASMAQQFGPYFAKRLKETPEDPDGAYNKALEDASISGAFSAGSWAAFPLKAFSGPIKNMMFQAFGVQPAVGMTQKAVENVRQGQPTGQDLGQAYVESAVGTAVPMAGHAIVSKAISPTAPKVTQEAAPGPEVTKAPEVAAAPEEPAKTYLDAPQSLQELDRVTRTERKPSFFTPAEAAPEPTGEGAGYKTMAEDTGIPKSSTISEELPSDKASAGGFSQIPDKPFGQRIHNMVEGLGLGDAVRDLQMKIAPMTARDATIESRAAAKDFANYSRQAQWEQGRWDDLLKKEFKPEELKSMWEAADEESVLKQQGLETKGVGLERLTPAQRDTVRMLQDRANEVFEAAKASGVVEADAEGLPSYVPRMVVMAGESGFKQPSKTKEGMPLDTIGRNLTSTTPNVKHRNYLTTPETEEAAQAKFGEGAQVVRDIRTLNIATSRLQQAVAGKSLINRIKEIGKQSGEPAVYEGSPPEDSTYKFFTLDHPSFKTWKPRLEKGEDGKWHAKVDDQGNPIFDKIPLYVRSDFEGPLRAVLSQKPGEVYRALMNIKMNSVGLIMYSPLIHNAVEFARALPIMPGKMLTLKVYRDGYTAKNDLDTMREFTKNGGVPIGDWRGHGGDAADLMGEPGRTSDKGWLTKGLRKYVSNAAADTTGNFLHFWHQTALWDLVANLQLGLYTNMRDKMLADGMNPDIAAKAAAHFANRYAGAVPNESMSQGARQLTNLAMFSRSFTVGNMGVMKDMFMGLPSDVQAQIARDHGLEALQSIKSKAQRKAVSAFMLDTGLYYTANSLLQNAANTYNGDEEPVLDGYIRRFNGLLGQIQENPLVALNPFYLANKLSATSDNEPGKENRIHIGNMANGTGIYMRNPFGKIGEEFIGYATEPISMFNRKQSTLMRPLMQVIANDQGFGHKVYNPNAETPDELMKNAGKIAWHFVTAQTPELALTGLWDLAAQRGDADTRTIEALQTFGPLAGLTFSKGYPGGMAEGFLNREKSNFEYRFNEAKPGIRKLIQSGDTEAAQEQMVKLGVPAKDQKSFIKNTLNPGKISGRSIQNFNQRASETEKARLEQLMQGHAPGGRVTNLRDIIERYAPQTAGRVQLLSNGEQP
jgi:hypothetical protein